MTSAGSQRQEMVERQLIARGISDPRTIEAMRTVPREQFVPKALASRAYEDSALPIEESQTISQPYIVALMIEALRPGPDDRALEVGAGSGYAAAVLGRVAREVHAIERFPMLAARAKARLAQLGYDNVHVLCGDGTRGLPEHAPFDVILVSAGGREIPHCLLEQLAIGGRLVIPVGRDRHSQELRRIRRLSADRFEEESLGRVQFVPLVPSDN